MDELLFSIFRFAKKVVTPFKELCLHLVFQLHHGFATLWWIE